MRMKRYWMTGCMALMLLAAASWPRLDEQQEGDKPPSAWLSLISKHSVDITVRQIQRAAKAHQMAVVAQAAPHGSGAPDVAEGARVLVLGDTDGHTPAMQSDQQIVPDLPMKVLVYQRPDGRTEVRFTDPRGLKREEGAPRDWRARLAALPQVLKAALA
jgi:uncharacterized protein (DUF302 family)